MRFEHATRIMPLGIFMGIAFLVMIFINEFWVGGPFFIFFGGVGGVFLVSVDAVVYDRGGNLKGGGG